MMVMIFILSVCGWCFLLFQRIDGDRPLEERKQGIDTVVVTVEDII